MKAPSTYFEWKELLERFARGEDEDIHLMNEGTITLDAGTAGRFMVLFEETYRKRKQLWLDKFKNSLHNPGIRSASDIYLIISQGKAGLKNLILYTDLKPFREDLKKTLKDDLKAFVTEVKNSLKKNVMRDKPDQLNLLLLAFDSLDVEKISAPAPPPQPQNTGSTKKRIIL